MAKNLRSPRMSSHVRSLAIIGIDAAIAAGSLVLALQLRFEGAIPSEEMRTFLPVLTLLISARLCSSLFFRLNRWSFRFSGLTDGARVAMAGLSGTGLLTLGLYLSRFHSLPRSVVVLELLMSTAGMAAVRFLPRLLWLYRADLLRARRDGSVRALILGAGAAGEMLLRDLRRSTEHGYQVLGFVDDRPDRWGDIVGGKTVLGGVSDLPQLAPRFGIEVILIAVPRIAARRVREILTLCSDLKLRFKITPVSYLDLRDRVTSSILEDLSPQDLLDRDEVRFHHADGAPPDNRLVMVTGAAGSIGSELCRQILEMGCQRLSMMDIDENGLYLLRRRLERRYPDRLLFADVGDIRDESRVRALFAQHHPRDIFHAAARKHVPLMECAPSEAVKTNVVGTRILARAAHDFEAERFVYMSTDKAVRPTSVMGATKRLGELLVRQMDDGSETRFSAVRFGNVLDSAGSVVPIFREQIAHGGPVTVTHPEVRRFFMTISEAVGLVLRAAYGDYGQLCVLEMGEPIRILDLARHMITMAGHIPDVDVRIELTGLRPGDKLYEEILADGEEISRRIDRKVSVVSGPPLPEDLPEVIDEVAAWAAAEDSEGLYKALRHAIGEPDLGPAVFDAGAVESKHRVGVGETPSEN